MPDCISNWGIKILQRNDNIKDGGYIFSGGSTFRDWKLFIETARMLPQYRFMGVARKTGFPQEDIPGNIEMYFDVEESVFNELLKNCRVVFMPIKVKTQGGQIVIFKGGLFHKPVVTTDTAAIKTYIEDGRNGLLIKFKNTESAVLAIDKIMSDDMLRTRLGDELYNDIKKLTPSHFVDLLTAFLKTKNFKL